MTAMTLIHPPRVVRLLLTSIAVVAAASPATARETKRSRSDVNAKSAARSVRKLTGSRTRMVWIRKGKLVFFDTDDGKGYVEKDLGLNCDRPVITPSGRQVVFIDYGRWTSYVVDWGSDRPTALVEGRVTYVRPDWTDVDDGRPREWIYWQTKENEIRTAPLDDPNSSEVVWKFEGWKPRKGKSTNWQTSADGRRVGATFPWPHNGILDLAEKTQGFEKYGTGCWPQIARDNSYRFFHCVGGAHQYLGMYEPGQEKGWMIRINPRTGSAECPRWLNDTRFVVCTDRPSRKSPWVYIGQFSDNYRKFTTWIPVCADGRNSAVDGWVEAASKKPPAPHRKAASEAPGKDKADTSGSRELGDTWPGTHDGLVFLWEHTTSGNRLEDANGKEIRRCSAKLRGSALPGLGGAARLNGGWMEAEGVSRALQAACRDSDAFTLELTMTASQASTEKELAIAAFAGKGDLKNFALTQLGRRLVLRLRTSRTDKTGKGSGVVVGIVRASKPSHLVVTFDDGVVRAYQDGEYLGAKNVGGDLSTWDPLDLTFGGRSAGRDGWNGDLEAIAILNRAVPAAEVKKRHELASSRYKNRTQPSRIVVDARLLEKTAAPDPSDIDTYPRALAVYAYEVTEVHRGEMEKGSEIHVAHWMILDSKKLQDTRQKGQTYRLTLEKLSDHPELKSEYQANDLESFDATVYVDTASPGDEGAD